MPKSEVPNVPVGTVGTVGTPMSVRWSQNSQPPGKGQVQAQATGKNGCIESSVEPRARDNPDSCENELVSFEFAIENKLASFRVDVVAKPRTSFHHHLSYRSMLPT
jgi:hypothetical protein